MGLICVLKKVTTTFPPEFLLSSPIRSTWRTWRMFCAGFGHQRQRTYVHQERVLVGCKRIDVQRHEDRWHSGRGRRRRRQWRGYVLGDQRLGQRRVQYRSTHGSLLLDWKTGLRGGERSAAISSSSFLGLLGL